MKDFDSLVDLMRELREKCPWDREQNLSTLRRYLIEESYESLEALQNFIEEPQETHYAHLKEELGDLLLQILFQTKILQEQRGGDPLRELMIELRDKLVRRHPHVFGDKPDLTQSADAVYQQWSKIKESEKGSQTKASTLAKVAKSVPAMAQSFEIGKRCQKIGFDWIDSAEVWSQVKSELKELEQATSIDEKENEWGDLCFSLVQWARHEKIDPEVALLKMNIRFRRRFEWMESEAQRQQKNFESLSRDEMEQLWVRAKDATH